MIPIDLDNFCTQWLAGFNSHDLEMVLELFAENVTFASPLAARLFPSSAGVLHGKSELRSYWTRALELSPALHFEIVDAYVGVASLVLRYRNHSGQLVSEVMTFDEHGLVVDGLGAYQISLAGAAGN